MQDHAPAPVSSAQIEPGPLARRCVTASRAFAAGDTSDGIWMLLTLLPDIKRYLDGLAARLAYLGQRNDAARYALLFSGRRILEVVGGVHELIDGARYDDLGIALARLMAPALLESHAGLEAARHPRAAAA
jgi:hypothetical protein